MLCSLFLNGSEYLSLFSLYAEKSQRAEMNYSNHSCPWQTSLILQEGAVNSSLFRESLPSRFDVDPMQLSISIDLRLHFFQTHACLRKIAPE